MLPHLSKRNKFGNIIILILGDTSKLVELLLDGYDHITDIVDEDDTTIIDIVARENQPDTVSFLQSILAFEVENSEYLMTFVIDSIIFFLGKT